MLNTYDQIRNDVLVKLNHTTTMAFYTEAILGAWIQEAHVWAAAYKKWPFTEGRASTTYASLVSNEDGYLTGVYPENWKPDSIRRLTVGGYKVDKREFYSFAQFLEDNPNDTKRIYSNFGQLYYINPKLDVSGTVTAWGQYTPVNIDITDLNALTAFSGTGEEGNEAISLEVQSYAKKREQKTNEAEALHNEAQIVLDRLWANYNAEAAEYETADNDGMFARFDVLDGRPNDGFHRDRWS